MNGVLLIGIAGPSAGGKTSVTEKIYDKFSATNHVTVISYDDYYKDQTKLTMEERIKTNYDHPNAFDTDLLVKHLNMLKNFKSIEKPVYDFVAHNRSSNIEKIENSSIVIIEGLFTLLDNDIRKLLDIKLYVEEDPDICFIRRLQRDMNERGRSLDAVINQYTKFVKPMQEQFIEPTRKYADLILLHGGKNIVAIDMVGHMINNYIEKGSL
ncbi:MAG: uridine kinase [Mycoplasmatales bacterium]